MNQRSAAAPRAHLAAAYGARLRAVLSLVGLSALAALVGWAFAGWAGILLGAVGAVLVDVGALRFGDSFLMRRLGARPLTAWEAPGVHRAVSALAARAGVPAPRLWVAPLQGPNAITFGRRGTHIVVGQNLPRVLDDRSLLAVLAHEVAHVANRDASLLATATLASSAVQGLSFAARLFGLALFALGLVGLGAAAMNQGLLLAAIGVGAPILSVLLVTAMLRANEYAADATAAALTGDPHGLAAALLAIDGVAARRRAWASLIGLGRPQGPTWLATHPPTAARVARLLSYAGSRSER